MLGCEVLQVILSSYYQRYVLEAAPTMLLQQCAMQLLEHGSDVSWAVAHPLLPLPPNVHSRKLSSFKTLSDVAVLYSKEVRVCSLCCIKHRHLIVSTHMILWTNFTMTQRM
jgi:hypothetical protein